MNLGKQTIPLGRDLAADVVAEVSIARRNVIVFSERERHAEDSANRDDRRERPVGDDELDGAFAELREDRRFTPERSVGEALRLEPAAGLLLHALPHLGEADVAGVIRRGAAGPLERERRSTRRSSDRAGKRHCRRDGKRVPPRRRPFRPRSPVRHPVRLRLCTRTQVALAGEKKASAMTVARPLLRRRRVTRRLLLASAALAAPALVRAPVRAAQFEFKCGSIQPSSDPSTIRAAQMWSAIQRESGGRIHIQFFPDGTLGGDQAELQQLRTGAIQFLVTTAGNLSSVIPSFDMVPLGFAFADADEAMRIFDGALGDYIRSETSAKGMHALRTFADGGMFEIGSNTHHLDSRRLTRLQATGDCEPYHGRSFQGTGRDHAPAKRDRGVFRPADEIDRR